MWTQRLIKKFDLLFSKAFSLGGRVGNRFFDTSLLNLGGCPAAFSKEKKSGNLNLFDFVDYLDSINEPHLIIKDKIKDIENKIQNLI